MNKQSSTAIFIRISLQEGAALRKLAAQESRSMSNWFRSRLVREAKEKGLLSASEQSLSEVKHAPAS